MRKNNNLFRVCHCLFLFSILVIFGCVDTVAQEVQQKKLKLNLDSVMPVKYRLAFKTNVIDWALLAPNVGFEFDLSKSPYLYNTLNFNLKSNWFTPHSSNIGIIYDYTIGRIEFRHYRRPNQKNSVSTGEKMTFQQKMANLVSWSRNKPKHWRAYYLGGYLDAGTYNFKFSQTGYRGKFVGAGFSLGFGVPIYEYSGGALDLEVGGSVGMICSLYDTYELNKLGGNYQYVKQDKISILPAVSEIRVALVYRFSSIKNKYKYTDPRIAERKLERKQQKELEKKMRSMRSDSLKLVREMEKIKKDSLENLIKEQKSVDSIAVGTSVNGEDKNVTVGKENKKSLFKRFSGKKNKKEKIKSEEKTEQQIDEEVEVSGKNKNSAKSKEKKTPKNKKRRLSDKKSNSDNVENVEEKTNKVLDSDKNNNKSDKKEKRKKKQKQDKGQTKEQENKTVDK